MQKYDELDYIGIKSVNINLFFGMPTIENLEDILFRVFDTNEVKLFMVYV